jgi:predicted transporter
MKNDALNLRRLLAHVVLGLLLLFSQQHAVQHWLTHAVEATKNQSAPAAEHCEACDGLVAFGAALPAPPPSFTVFDGFEHVQPVIRLTQPVLATSPVAYLSRAPPTLG